MAFPRFPCSGNFTHVRLWCITACAGLHGQAAEGGRGHRQPVCGRRRRPSHLQVPAAPAVLRPVLESSAHALTALCSWRGADPSHMLQQFPVDFPHCTTLFLASNYRCSFGSSPAGPAGCTARTARTAGRCALHCRSAQNIIHVSQALLSFDSEPGDLQVPPILIRQEMGHVEHVSGSRTLAAFINSLLTCTIGCLSLMISKQSPCLPCASALALAVGAAAH